MRQPDLTCTKMCPKLVKTGVCCKRATCKFAHSENELRRLDVDDYDLPAGALGQQAFYSQQLEQQALDQQVDDSAAASQQVVEQLSNAADAGNLTLVEMTLHLTSVFGAVYKARPGVEAQLKMTAPVLSAATTVQAWSDAGLAATDRMAFAEVVRWCSTKGENALAMRIDETPTDSTIGSEASRSPSPSHHRISTDFDATDEDAIAWPSESISLSACSTDDDASKPISPQCVGWQPAPGSQNRTKAAGQFVTEPANGDDDNTIEGFELKVRNTFIDLVPSARHQRSRAKHFTYHCSRGCDDKGAMMPVWLEKSTTM